MLGNLSTKFDTFDDRILRIEGEIGRIRRHWNILVLNVELDEDLRDDAEEHFPTDE